MLNTIRYDWPQLLQEQANPIEMAVGLLDDTSVGMAHRMPEFSQLQKQTGRALRRVVNEHHELFNNSIGSYHQLIQTLSESQNDAHEIKTMLEDTTREVHDRSDMLTELSQTSSRYTELIGILDAVAEVTAIPEKIDRLVGEKKIHEVYDVILDGYEAAKKYGLWQLPALGSIQSYLEVQSNNLFDMLVDELQNEIYLKAHGVVLLQLILNLRNSKLSSFKQLLRSLTTLEQYIHNLANLDFTEIADALTELSRKFLSQLTAMNEKVNMSGSLVGYAQTIEDEGYQYIFLLLRTASKLNRLHQAVEVLSSAHHLEIHGLISRTTEETKARHLTTLGKLTKTPEIHTIANASLFSDNAVGILEDFFSSVFMKLLAVLQKHKVVAACVREIEGGSYNMDAVFLAITKEIEQLIMSYIHDLPHLKEFKDILSNKINDVLRKKELFRFEDADVDSTTGPEDLQKMLQEMFPGFVLSDVFKEESNGIFVLSEGYRGGVEVLVPRSIFNMRIVLEFFLVFVAGANIIRGKDKSTDGKEKSVNFRDSQGDSRDSGLSRSNTTNDANGEIYRSDTVKSVNRKNIETFDSPIEFFSRFMKQYFISHVKNSLESSFQELVGIPLRRDVITVENHHIIYENALSFQKLFVNACVILNTSITYRPAISDVALQFLESFGRAYHAHYIELLDSTNPVPQYGRWMNIEGLTETSKLVMESSEGRLIEQENQLMLELMEDLSKDDCLDNETFNQVCYLLLSSTWILTWLPQLKKVSTGSEPVIDVDHLRDEWSFLENGRNQVGLLDNVFLALDVSGIGQFNAIVRQFEQIKLRTTLALRYDLRCKGVYSITRSFLQTDWRPLTEPGDADQHIALLNKDVFQIDNKLTQFLSDDERDGIFAGLAEFLNDLVIRESRRISIINNNGIKRVLLNIHTLQQMLRNVLKAPEAINFTRASVFFEMFTMNEFTFLNAVQQGGYAVEEYKNMARLMYSEKLADGGTQFNRGKYNELLKKIEERSK